MPGFDELRAYRQGLLERYQGQAQTWIEWALRLAAGAAVAADGEAWTPHQILAHVRDVELQAYLPRLSLILDEEAPTFKDFDAETWMAAHYEPQEPPAAVAADFRAARAEGLRRLKRLPDDRWNRTGVHPQVGARTLQWWLERAVAHAQEHLDALDRKGSDG